MLSGKKILIASSMLLTTAWMSSAEATTITYNVFDQIDVGNSAIIVTGEITTDGTFGGISAANILDYQLTATYNNVVLTTFQPDSFHQISSSSNGLSASATALTFDASIADAYLRFKDSPFNEYYCLQGSLGLCNFVPVSGQHYLNSNMGGGGGELSGVFQLGTVSAVPGPIVGAGLPGILMAFGGLITWRRRRMAAA